MGSGCLVSVRPSTTAPLFYGVAPKQNNWRTLVVNCNNIHGKASQLQAVTNYIDLYIVSSSGYKRIPSEIQGHAESKQNLWPGLVAQQDTQIIGQSFSTSDFNNIPTIN